MSDSIMTAQHRQCTAAPSSLSKQGCSSPFQPNRRPLWMGWSKVTFTKHISPPQPCQWVHANNSFVHAISWVMWREHQECRLTSTGEQHLLFTRLHQQHWKVLPSVVRSLFRCCYTLIPWVIYSIPLVYVTFCHNHIGVYLYGKRNWFTCWTCHHKFNDTCSFTAPHYSAQLWHFWLHTAPNHLTPMPLSTPATMETARIN